MSRSGPKVYRGICDRCGAAGTERIIRMTARVRWVLCDECARVVKKRKLERWDG